MEVKWIFVALVSIFTVLEVNHFVLSAPLKGKLISQQLENHFVKWRASGVKTSVLCDACTVMVATIRKLTELHSSEKLIEKAVTELCEKFKLEDDHVCEMIVPEFKTEVLYVFDHTALSSREICGTILDNKCGSMYDPFNQTWNVSIPGDKPPIMPYKPPSAKSPSNRILHVSDVHWDPLYTPGLQARCNEPLCCRPPMEKGSADNSAGFWGDVHCDLPLATVTNFMEQLNRTQDQFDWVYLTGDLPAHNDWNQSKADQIKALDKVINLFKEYLPTKPVFFSFGNHESAPVNSFPPSFITGDNSISWLYDEAANIVKTWINTPDALTTFRSGGYFSIDFNGFRIISLQTNFCNSGNWWMLINSTDPDGMLKWFTDKLADAEQKRIKVHILGHISPGNGDCLSAWSNNYKKIALRFESTIAGQFFGHSHEDRLQVLIDFESSSPRPYGTLYIGPSVTPYTYQNPGYRIYTIDGTYNDSTRQVLDHETYFLNLTDANLTNKPKWDFEYSAKDAYNMTDLTAESWLSVLKRFYHDHDLFLKYYHYMTKSINLNDQCSGGCQDYLICSAVITFSNNINPCSILTSNPISPEEMVLYASAHDHC